MSLFTYIEHKLFPKEITPDFYKPYKLSQDDIFLGQHVYGESTPELVYFEYIRVIGNWISALEGYHDDFEAINKTGAFKEIQLAFKELAILKLIYVRPKVSKK